MAEPPISYEDLAAIEDDFEEIDTEIIKQQYHLSRPAFDKRAEAVAKIENFWPLVLEQAPPELDQYISVEDSKIFAHSLVKIEVTRPELEKDGSPRSFTVKFHFKDSEHFSNETLEKNFSYRRASDGWTGLVSEPVKIDWKEGKDLTEGLTDGAIALWEQRKKLRDMQGKDSSAYTELKKKVEHWNGANTSFFTWFGWISGRRWVSAEESEQANKEHKAKKETRSRGEKAEAPQEPDDEENDANDDSEVEVHEAGEDVAISIADDLWPNAIKYFTQGQEIDAMSDVDFEVDDLDEAEDDDDDDEDKPIDIRSLVQGKGKGRLSDAGPPVKKQKK